MIKNSTVLERLSVLLNSEKLKEKIDKNKVIIVPVFDVTGRVEKIWKIMEKC